MEKPLAQQAGLGWQGKHTNLVSREFGSWLFLGEIYLSLALAPDAARSRPLRRLPALSRCLPDRRVPGPLPARCAALHLVSDDRAQGADPARAAPADRQPHLWLRRLPRGLPVEQIRPRHARNPTSCRATELTAPRLAELAAARRCRRSAACSPASPVKRIGRDRFIRNVLIAIGNAPAPTPELVAAAEARLDDASPLVRATAIWACDRLMPGSASASACGTIPTRWCGRNVRKRPKRPRRHDGAAIPRDAVPLRQNRAVVPGAFAVGADCRVGRHSAVAASCPEGG